MGRHCTRRAPWAKFQQRAWFARAVLVAAALASLLNGVAPRPAAAAAPILWGAWVGKSPLDSSAIDAFEQRAGRQQSIIHFGQPWWHGKSYVPFRATEFEAIRKRGAIPLFDWGSWDYSVGLNQPDFRLASVASGAHDAYIAEWARSARAWGQPFFLRFNPEMNGWWLPWSEQVNGNHNGEFVRAWRHVVDIFRQQGATNAQWVWCPNIASPRSTPLSSLYPGNDYVDWTCMDGYNWGTDNKNKWQTFAEVFAGSSYNGNHNTYQEILDLAPDKPMMIGETGTSRDGGDPGAWVKDALQNQLPNNFSKIRAIVWFNWDADDPALDWPIENTPAIQQAFANSLASGYYTANEFGGLTAASLAAFGSPIAVAQSQPQIAASPAPSGPVSDGPLLVAAAPADEAPIVAADFGDESSIIAADLNADDRSPFGDVPELAIAGVEQA